MEGNQVECKGGVNRKEREREHTRICYRPTGGWAMHVSQRDIVLGISAEQVDQANRPWDFLESHAIPGVMLCGLSIVHKRETIETKGGNSKKGKIVRANWHNCNIDATTGGAEGMVTVVAGWM